MIKAPEGFLNFRQIAVEIRHQIRVAAVAIPGKRVDDVTVAKAIETHYWTNKLDGSETTDDSNRLCLTQAQADAWIPAFVEWKRAGSYGPTPQPSFSP